MRKTSHYTIQNNSSSNQMRGETNVEESIPSSSQPRPEPSDFVQFLPYLCRQLDIIDFSVEVTQSYKVKYDPSLQLKENVLQKVKSNNTTLNTFNKSQLEITDENKKRPVKFLPSKSSKIIKINAIYNTDDNLTNITIQRNQKIPQELIKIIGLLLPYHPFLQTIAVTKGINSQSLYQLNKLLTTFNITEIILDGSFIEEANYYILLRENTQLKHLSLAKCSLNDAAMKLIADNLVYPMPASKQLQTLNLSSNRITDFCAKCLGDALRSNIQLYHLNLFNNYITDKGASYILDSLQEFPLNFKEVIDVKTKYINYLKEKEEVVKNLAKKLREEEIENSKIGSKSKCKVKVESSPNTPMKKNKQEFASKYNFSHISLSFFQEKAKTMCDTIIEEFSHPFSKSNTNIKENVVYSYGNNVLCYLNLGCNHLSYLSIVKILEVLKYQKNLNRNPIGLIKVVVEGNHLPKFCKELDDINLISNLIHNNVQFKSDFAADKKKIRKV